jgi:predicted DNA-binding transcriptional regulator AlpA
LKATDCRLHRKDTVMDKLLRLPEVADLIGVPENTPRFWRHPGTGPQSARLGRRVVYRERDVFAWIDQQFNLEVGTVLA